MTDGSNVFGGPWTNQKLAILREYLSAYTTALSNTPFKKGYIGTGLRETSASAKLDRTERFGLVEPAEADGEPVRRFLDGSARVALQCNPAFDSYVFIEKSPARCQELERLKIDFPHMAKKISIMQGDANTQIQGMCDKNWKRHRAVLFLDPYGTEVRWRTLEAIAQTKAIDLWILFPLGAVNRMLTQSARSPRNGNIASMNCSAPPTGTISSIRPKYLLRYSTKESNVLPKRGPRLSPSIF
jgi:three-Cys-motif partner protein